jgi:hypothetical protein
VPAPLGPSCSCSCHHGGSQKQVEDQEIELVRASSFREVLEALAFWYFDHASACGLQLQPRVGFGGEDRVATQELDVMTGAHREETEREGLSHSAGRVVAGRRDLEREDSKPPGFGASSAARSGRPQQPLESARERTADGGSNGGLIARVVTQEGEPEVKDEIVEAEDVAKRR